MIIWLSLDYVHVATRTIPLLSPSLFPELAHAHLLEAFKSSIVIVGGVFYSSGQAVYTWWTGSSRVMKVYSLVLQSSILTYMGK